MRVSGIQQNQYNTNFNAWFRDVYKDAKSEHPITIIHRNTTYFYRRDMDWPNLVKHLVHKFENVPKVNTYCYGCSNGSEPYTFIMQLCSRYPEFISKKFLPVIAKDYDEVAINNAKKGVVSIGQDELTVVRNAINGPEEQFFQYTGVCNDNDSHSGTSWEVKYQPEYAQAMQFSVADIKDDYKNIEPENSIIFARNFWPYLQRPEIDNLIQKLSGHLKKDSCVILGGFDNTMDVGSYFVKYGFKKEDYPISDVYTKL